MRFVSLLRSGVLACALAGGALGCGDDDLDDGSGGGGAGGSSSSASGSGSASSGGTGGYEACLATMQVIDGECADAPLGAIEWVGVGAGKCMGSLGNSGGFARILMSSAQTDPEGNPTILGIRLEPEDGNAPQQGDRIELTAAPTHLVTTDVPLPVDLPGGAVIEPMLFGGALGFLRGDTDDAGFTLEAAITQQQLLDGGTLRGTFRLIGGTYTTLDTGGAEVDTVDPAAEVRGCFHVPYELYPIELDQ